VVPVESGRLAQGQPLIVMHPDDDVATALRDLRPGERLACGAGREDLAIVEPVPFGHKVALHPLARGAAVHKYGAVIGRTTCAVGAGQHVHVHNLEGLRGRGDLAGSVRSGEAGSDAAGR